MKNKKKNFYLGIGKTMFNTGATLLQVKDRRLLSWETVLSERVERKKFSRSWPLSALKKLTLEEVKSTHIGHNSDIEKPSFKEELLASKSPFYELLKASNLSVCIPHLHSSNTFILLSTINANKQKFNFLFRDSPVISVSVAWSQFRHSLLPTPRYHPTDCPLHSVS